jgi:hypothetical protein
MTKELKVPTYAKFALLSAFIFLTYVLLNIHN